MHGILRDNPLRYQHVFHSALLLLHGLYTLKSTLGQEGGEGRACFCGGGWKGVPLPRCH